MSAAKKNKGKKKNTNKKKNQNNVNTEVKKNVQNTESKDSKKIKNDVNTNNKEKNEKTTAINKDDVKNEESKKDKNIAEDKKDNSEKENIKEEPKKGKKKNSKGKQNNNSKTEKNVISNTEKSENKISTEKEIKQEQLEKEEKNKLIKKGEENLVTSDKPEYVEQMLKNRKRKTIIFVCLVMIIIIVTAFSTMFALKNVNNNNIVSGVSIKGFDVSNLSSDEARSMLNEKLNNELLPELKLKYDDKYEMTIKPEQIEFSYDIENIIDEAYWIGRNGNIVLNNYTLLGTSLFGKNLDMKYTYNEELLGQLVDTINSEIPGVVIEPSFYIEGTKLIIEKGTDGLEVEKDKFKNMIIDAIVARNSDEIIDDSYSQEIAIPVKEAKAQKIDINKIYEEIHTEPKDAYFETEPYKIYPDVDGIDLAITIEEAKKQIEAEDKQEYTFDLNITKASKTINDLGLEAFPYVISTFSTKYDASNVNRSTNLKLAAEKINGKVLMPGEEFSFNQVVGKRTVEEGYRDAKIYADGGVVDGLAGGICQISSTLYNAVLMANLEITERRNHTYTTSYLPAGRDATVVYGTKDFKFKNSRTYPIKIEASVSGGIAEFKINGIAEENEYNIKIIPVTTGTLPYATSYVQDPTLAPGQQITSQGGHIGYKVTTYKEVSLNGEIISKDAISNDTYSPMTAIIRVGP